MHSLLRRVSTLLSAASIAALAVGLASVGVAFAQEEPPPIYQPLECGPVSIPMYDPDHQPLYACGHPEVCLLRPCRAVLLQVFGHPVPQVFCVCVP